jgi:N-acetylglucosaminyldiphosphoundecaprenol N-acetyl-beta-D-mannosaminyltransferase
MIRHRHFLGMKVDATSYQDATMRVLDWAGTGESRYVCIATVHMVMEACDSLGFRQAVNRADLVTPDGMPLVWGLRLLGVPHATRVYGPDLTRMLLERSAEGRIPVGLYGGTQSSIARLREILPKDFPGVNIVFAESPPFRPLRPEEDRTYVEQINRSGVRLLFVGLGCPKQECWMAEHIGQVRAVTLGVGAAFDFLAGTKPQAPDWMQHRGLEWLFRLIKEPRRLWRRYLVHGPRFVLLFGLQLLRFKLFGDPRAS